MPTRSLSQLAMVTILATGLACASTTARVDDRPSAAALDTAATNTASDTTTAVQGPAGYRGMERDTSDTRNSPDGSDRTLPGMAQQDSTSGMGTIDSVGTDTSIASPSTSPSMSDTAAAR